MQMHLAGERPVVTTSATHMPNVVVMLGPPGSGKGTKCERLSGELDLTHVSIGDVLRSRAVDGSSLGSRLRDDTVHGRLVPDDIVVRLATDELRPLEGSGALLDGFPRTIAQAEALDAAFPGSVALAVLLAVPIETVLSRLVARRRPDDHCVAISERLRAFAEQTRPLAAWYGAQGLLTVVDGNQPVGLVTRAVQRRLVSIGFGGHSAPPI